MSNSNPSSPGATLDIDRSVIVLVNFLANRLTSTGSATYRRHFGLSITDFRTLVMLAAEPHITGQRICAVIGLDPGAASRSLAALTKRGLVEAQPDQRHPSYRSWSLTTEGQALHRESVEIALERSRLLLKDLTATEEDILIDLLRRMLDRVPELAQL